ncbi:hypothetical protein Tco_0749908 [Tanacetum coccineum]|uniref:Uncharacterized protein n=1 Tax=Tanacetum coccineum TaxID=301880 RepID=A0ABQ4Z2U5_9ASTR
MLTDVYRDKKQRLDYFDISFADALLHMLKFASTFKSLLITPVLKEDVFHFGRVSDFYTYPDNPSNLDDDYYDTKGDILFLEKLVNEELLSPNLPTMKNEDLKQGHWHPFKVLKSQNWASHGKISDIKA